MAECYRWRHLHALAACYFCRQEAKKTAVVSLSFMSNVGYILKRSILRINSASAGAICLSAVVPQYIRSDNGLVFTASRCEIGLAESRCKRCSLSPAAHGEMVTLRASTASFVMSCWPEKSLTRCSSSVGDVTTTACDRIAVWATDPRPPKRFSPTRSLRLRLFERAGLARRPTQH